MPLAASAIVWLGVLVACSSPKPTAQEPTPTQQSEWRSPVHDMPKCASNADCPAEQICRPRIAAACEACDGGQVIQVCDAPNACADDTNCTAPQTCQNGGCR